MISACELKFDLYASFLNTDYCSVEVTKNESLCHYIPYNFQKLFLKCFIFSSFIL